VSADDVEVGGRIEYLITLFNSDPPVKIRCLGKVLRSSGPRPAAQAKDYYEVACTMERYSFVRSEEFQTVAAPAE
jgi:hypothetical protein